MVLNFEKYAVILFLMILCKDEETSKILVHVYFICHVYYHNCTVDLWALILSSIIYKNERKICCI